MTDPCSLLPSPSHLRVPLQSYIGIAWSTWMVAVSILWSPFWFNPQTFQLERVKDDYEAWMLWMKRIC